MLIIEKKLGKLMVMDFLLHQVAKWGMRLAVEAYSELSLLNNSECQNQR